MKRKQANWLKLALVHLALGCQLVWFASSAVHSARLSRQLPPAGGQQQAPKLVQWSREPVHYYEASTLVLSCSLAMSMPSGSQLKFMWFKGNKLIGAGGDQLNSRLTIETLAEYSLMRLADLRPTDSGAYSCAVINAHGQEDRTSAQVTVNVKLKWLPNQNSSSSSGGAGGGGGGGVGPIKRLAVGNGHEFQLARANSPLALECAASGQPRPHIRWFRLLPPGGATQKQTGAKATPATKFPNNNNNNRRLHADGLNSHQAARFGFSDEQQIREALAQWDNLPDSRPNFLRLELTGSELSQTSWRIETSDSAETDATQLEVRSRLILDKAEPNASGLYECEVIAASQALSSVQSMEAADRLQRLFGLLVNGRCKLVGGVSDWTISSGGLYPPKEQQ